MQRLVASPRLHAIQKRSHKPVVRSPINLSEFFFMIFEMFMGWAIHEFERN